MLTKTEQIWYFVGVETFLKENIMITVARNPLKLLPAFRFSCINSLDHTWCDYQADKKTLYVTAYGLLGLKGKKLCLTCRDDIN